MRTGIVAHGAYVPRYRIRSEEIRKFWGTLSTPGIQEKAFPGYDEDVITMAVEACSQALDRSGIPAERIRALFLATTSGPYEEKPNASTVATALSGSTRLRVVELGGTARGGAMALLAGLEFSKSWGEPCLVVASDAPLAHPASSLEHGLGAGAAAFMLAPDEQATVLEAVESVSVETFGERFRRRGGSFLQDLELRQDELSGCVDAAVGRLLNGLGVHLQEFNAVVLPDPDSATAPRLAKKLGISRERLVSVTSRVGDAGAAGVLLAMVHALDTVQAGHRILVVSYGAGADAMSWVVGEATVRSRCRGARLEEILSKGKLGDYAEYLRIRGFLSRGHTR